MLLPLPAGQVCRIDGIREHLTSMNGEHVRVVRRDHRFQAESYVCDWKGAEFVFPREQLVPEPRQ